MASSVFSPVWDSEQQTKPTETVRDGGSDGGGGRKEEGENERRSKKQNEKEMWMDEIIAFTMDVCG